MSADSMPNFVKVILTIAIIHFVGMPVYLVVVDELYCQGSYHDKSQNQCYEWKGAVGMWEAVLFQELVVRPIIKRIK